MLLLSFSCSAVSVARLPALLIGQKPALLLGFSLVVLILSPIYILIPQNHQGEPRKHFSTTATFCTHEIPSRGLFRHPVGGGFDHGGPLHQLYCPSCRCQNRRISGRGSRTMRLGRMVTGGRGHDVLPRFGPS